MFKPEDFGIAWSEPEQSNITLALKLVDIANAKIQPVLEELQRLQKLCQEQEQHGTEFANKVVQENQQLRKLLDDLIVKIIGRSHSWVIREETAHIEKPIHDSYRTIAEYADKLWKLNDIL